MNLNAIDIFHIINVCLASKQQAASSKMIILQNMNEIILPGTVCDYNTHTHREYEFRFVRYSLHVYRAFLIIIYGFYR